MDFMELVRNRRSVRSFRDEKIPQDIIDKIIAATLTAPSAKNTKTTKIVAIDDKEVLEFISTMRPTGSDFVKDAPMAFIILGDDKKSDLWRENCAISATILQLAAHSFGLGTCWVHVNGRLHKEGSEKTAGELLREKYPALLPYRILCVVAAGYIDEKKSPHDLKLDNDKIITL